VRFVVVFCSKNGDFDEPVSVFHRGVTGLVVR
jgi:hypothetical protein